MGDTSISLDDQIQMDLIEAYDAVQRRHGVDEETMIRHLQMAIDKEIQWAKERKIEAEEDELWSLQGWVTCDDCDGRGQDCASCAGTGTQWG